MLGLKVAQPLQFVSLSSHKLNEVPVYEEVLWIIVFEAKYLKGWVSLELPISSEINLY